MSLNISPLDILLWVSQSKAKGFSIKYLLDNANIRTMRMFYTNIGVFFYVHNSKVVSKQNYSQFILFLLMQPNLFRFDVTSCNCLLFTVFDEDDIFSNIFKMTSLKGTFLLSSCFYIFWFRINNYQLILFLEMSILFDLYQMVNIRIYVNNSLNNGRIKYKYSSAQ